MKFLVIIAVTVACAVADVSHILQRVSDESSAPILKSSSEIHPEGHFSYEFETGNGIITHTDGVVTNPNTEDAALEMKGYVKYTAPDGTAVDYEFVADRYGYKAIGSHIPVAPPIPDAILRSLQYIADHPAPVKRASRDLKLTNELRS